MPAFRAYCQILRNAAKQKCLRVRRQSFSGFGDCLLQICGKLGKSLKKICGKL